MIDGIVWFFQNIALAFYNFFYALTHPADWLNWSEPQAVMRFIYYGGSVEFFFVVFTAFLVLTLIGMWNNNVMWASVRLFEGIGNTVGRFAAWAGLLMVLQQVMIVFVQRVFASAQISLGFGIPFAKDISWWAEELKLYNAIVVCLCVSYTFIQGGHVRVDLVYSSVSYRTKKLIDMALDQKIKRAPLAGGKLFTMDIQFMEMMDKVSPMGNPFAGQEDMAPKTMSMGMSTSGQTLKFSISFK